MAIREQHQKKKNALNWWVVEIDVVRSERQSRELINMFMRYPRVRWVRADYSGSGDSGGMDDLTCLDADFNAVEVPDDVKNFFEELLWDKIEHFHGGFYNNDGGQGQAWLACPSGQFKIKHEDNIISTEYSDHEGGLLSCSDRLFERVEKTPADWE